MKILLIIFLLVICLLSMIANEIQNRDMSNKILYLEGELYKLKSKLEKHLEE